MGGGGVVTLCFEPRQKHRVTAVLGGRGGGGRGQVARGEGGGRQSQGERDRQIIYF